jgi:hypothetical protein
MGIKKGEKKYFCNYSVLGKNGVSTEHSFAFMKGFLGNETEARLLTTKNNQQINIKLVINCDD